MITTVTGDISSDGLQYILPHEHIFCDLRFGVAPLDDEDFYKPLTLQNFGKVTRNPYAVLDNALLDNIDIQVEELRAYKKAGGSLLVDVTTEDFGRDPRKLQEASEKSGVYVVAGCGSYHDGSVAEATKALSVPELYERIMKDLCQGMEDTDIRAGVIGEVGTSGEMTPYEKKSLEAASLAQRDTGCGMHIHACLWNAEGLNALKYAVKCGANPEKIAVDHSDVLLNEDYIMGIVENGGLVDFDDFGKEFYVDRKNRNLLLGSFAPDVQRVQFIKKLIDKGFVKQILVTNDICLKSMTHHYGGWGYDHVITNIIPMMEDFGISQKDIHTIMTENPIRFLERS